MKNFGLRLGCCGTTSSWTFEMLLLKTACRGDILEGGESSTGVLTFFPLRIGMIGGGKSILSCCGLWSG